MEWNCGHLLYVTTILHVFGKKMIFGHQIIGFLCCKIHFTGDDVPVSPFCMTNMGDWDKFRVVDMDKEVFSPISELLAISVLPSLMYFEIPFVVF